MTVVNQENSCQQLVCQEYIRQLNSSGVVQTISNGVQESMDKVVMFVNSIPQTIRTNTLNIVKLVAGNLQILGDVVSSVPDSKEPPVTKENLTIINYLKDKHPAAFKDIIEKSKEMKDDPSEKRLVKVLQISSSIMKLL
jgi:hypothetical protein